MLEVFNQLSPLLRTVLLAMVPVTEVNAAIPIAIHVYKLHPVLAGVFATLGTLIVILILLLIADRATKLLRSWHPGIDRFFAAVFAKTYHQHSPSFERWGSLALLIFVAIPGPLTGVWSASLLAYIFGIRLHHAVIYIGVGSAIASALVVLATLGVIRLSGL